MIMSLFVNYKMSKISCSNFSGIQQSVKKSLGDPVVPDDERLGKSCARIII